MAVPSSPNSRLFYRAAKQRYDDAAILLRMQRTTGAVYLAGYSVECLLKALILESVPRSQELAALGQFRGQQAHNFDWLLRWYKSIMSVNIPEDVLANLIRVNTWSTNIRYQPGIVDKDDAKRFINSVEQISLWAEGRL